MAGGRILKDCVLEYAPTRDGFPQGCSQGVDKSYPQPAHMVVHRLGITLWISILLTRLGRMGRYLWWVGMRSASSRRTRFLRW